MVTVEYEGVEHWEEGGVPETRQILGVELQVGGALSGDLVEAVQEHQEHGVEVGLAGLLAGLLGESVVPGELEPQADPHRLYQHLQAGPRPELLTEDDHGEGRDQK